MKQGAFTERLARCVEEERLLRGGERLLLAVSGGADSVLLLREMLFLKERFSLTLFVAHVEHGIRGEESLRDAAFVRELAERFGLPFSLLSVDAPALAASRKLSLEEAARTLRYEALTGEARRLACAAVVTAHHAQDQAETVLLRLFRGTGPAGLGGMAPSRELTEDIRLIRPLLWAQPEEIREELRRLEQPWQEDSTNRDESYRRNYLRQNILPHLKGIFPECVDHIDETAEDMRKIYSYFREMIRPLLSEAADGPLDAQALLALPAPAVPLCLKEWLALRGGAKDVSRVHLKALEVLARGPEGAAVSLPGGRTALKTGGKLTLRTEHAPDPEMPEAPPYTTRVFPYKKELQIPQNPYTKWMDYATIEKPVFRTRQEGDYFFLPDGGRKTVKSFFIDRKIPQAERDRIWLLAQGSHVLWIVGWRMSAAVRITENTRQVWEIHLGESDEKPCSEAPDR